MTTRRPGAVSVISVGQDDLFTGLPNCAVDHVPTGATITPFGPRGERGPRRLAAAVAGGCSGRYDLIVLPAIDFRWAYDDSRLKCAVRALASAVLQSRPTAANVNRLLARRGATVIILDRYDSDELLVDYLRCVSSARLYFKTNLREADRGRRYPTGNQGGCYFDFLPYWIAINNYQVSFQCKRDIDVFFAGAVNCEQRRASIDRVRELEGQGYRIKIVEGHLPFAEYLALMSRSWLTLSPQGYGYNGFRHYEAMLVGSVPLINRSDPPIVNDFHHGDNCFLYSLADADIQKVVKGALIDKPRLLRMTEGLWAFVVQHHSMNAIGRYLLRRALEGPPGQDE